MKLIKKLKMRRDVGELDPLLLCLIALLSLIGTLCVASAGYPYAHFRYHDGFYFIKKQIVFILIGAVVMLFCSRIPVSRYKALTPYLFAVSLLLLVLTLVIGSVGNGAKRWLSIGPISFQPSELTKLTLVLMLARYFSDNEERATLERGTRRSFLYGTAIPLLITAVPIVLVMLQHHLSCIIILALVGASLIFIASGELKYLGALGALGATGISALALFTDYTKDRITVWLDPESYKLTGGWQTLQGLMAIGSGGLFGVGYGQGVMKHLYVSEPANDMIFAILCEELGLVGALGTLLLFVLLITRGYKLALGSRELYSRLVAFGITTRCAIQILLNVAVVTNSIPNTGISLPFFSFGGSSLLMLAVEMGILLSISREARCD